MNLIRKKDPVSYKQPQEMYCSNYDCLSMIAKYSELYDLLDEYGVECSKYYCFDCIVNGNIE
jgi:hypothetical protein